MIGFGKERIDETLRPVAEVLKYGWHIPFGDHLIPTEVVWDNFRYYGETLNRMLM